MKVFVSGHRDLTMKEFNLHYYIELNLAMINEDTIYVCDYEGADLLVQQYLDRQNYEDVIVVHMKDSPRNHVKRFQTLGGFDSDEERDSFCTKNTDYDIAWSRREGSGTHQNILRRRLKDGIF